MMGLVKIQERGAVGRKMAAAFNAALKESWGETGRAFAANNIPRRFTREHAQEANYSPRAGENISRSSKLFWGSYTGRKVRKFGHNDPFVWSGETRRNARSARLTATGKGVRVSLPDARKLNYNPRYAAEFVAITTREGVEVGVVLDKALDARLQKATQ